MRALGYVKYIGKEMYELYEIRTCENILLWPWEIEFIDYPGKIEPKEGDIFLNWYWVPIAITIELNKYDPRDNLR